MIDEDAACDYNSQEEEEDEEDSDEDDDAPPLVHGVIYKQAIKKKGEPAQKKRKQ